MPHASTAAAPNPTCLACRYHEECLATGLPEETVIEIMRLLQAVSPETCIDQLGATAANGVDLKAAVTALDRHADLCLLWSESF